MLAPARVGCRAAPPGYDDRMEEQSAHEQGERQESETQPANDEQRAALQAEGSGMDEEQSETGEGILDHPEHSDAPGPFGTS